MLRRVVKSVTGGMRPHDKARSCPPANKPVGSPPPTGHMAVMPPTSSTSTLDLSARAGWPDELRVLIERYPREGWTGHGNLGAVAQFWLDRHAEFRALGNMLQTAADDFREAKLAPDDFRRFFAPRLQYFLQGLEGHHQMEDYQYFPIFRQAEPRLLKGFDVLEGDHEAIHADIVCVVDAANGLLRTLDGDGADKLRTATDVYVDTCGRLLKGLVRHLDDEEDLIVPVILDQGERKLFYG